MNTPFGPAIAGPFSTKAAFYSNYPHVGAGWDPEKHRGEAPLGADLHHRGPGGEDWLLVFCYPDSPDLAPGPKGDTLGVITAFDRGADEIWVLDNSISYTHSLTKYRVSEGDIRIR